MEIMQNIGNEAVLSAILDAYLYQIVLCDRNHIIRYMNKNALNVITAGSRSETASSAATGRIPAARSKPFSPAPTPERTRCLKRIIPPSRSANFSRPSGTNPVRSSDILSGTNTTENSKDTPEGRIDRK